jgi:polysaccharide biosynthesis transport protein
MMARRTRAASPGRDFLQTLPQAHDIYAAVDYRKHVGAVLKHRRLIAGIAAVALALGLLHTLLQTPTYRASATIQIKRAGANISGVAGLEPVETGASAEFYQTQYELLKSRVLAERVVSSLKLAEEPQLFEPPPSIMGTIRGFILASADDAQARSDSGRQDWALDAVMSGLSVEPVRSSTIVRISFDSASPVLAQQVANAVAENFITSNLERSFEASENARQFLEERLLELRLRLEESERELVSYAEEKDILLTGSDESLSTVNLTGANSALAAAAKRRLDRELQWRQAEAMGGAGLPQGLANDAIAKLRARRSQLVLEYEEKLKTRPGFPGMVQLRTRIEEIDLQISDEVNRIRESLRLQYEASLQEEQLLRQQLTGLKSEVMDYQNRNIQYTILQREVDTNRSLYEGLLQRYKEIGVAGGVDSGSLASNLSIVDRALIPGAPYKPSLSRNLATALLVGLMMGGAAAFGREFFDNSYRSPEDLEEDLELPVLGIIPLTNDVSDLKKSFSDQRSPPAEAYRSLRTALQFSTEAGAPRTLVVTSALAGEGKSTAAVNLAGQFAKLGLRVLLIDADLRKPSLHRLLNCVSSRGLSQYLLAGPTPPEVFQVSAQPNLTLLPGGPLAPNPAELLAGARMASLLAVAAERFDLVIVDAPPVGGLADAPLLASMSCGTLLVVEANKTHRRAVAAALKRLSFARAAIVGVVFNKFDASHAIYGDGYGEGYGDDGYYGYDDRTVPRLPGT